MNDRKKKKIFIPLFIFFIIINVGCFSVKDWLDAKGIDHFVLIGANAILFLLAVMSIYLLIRSMNNPNPNVFVRSVSAAVFIKLIVIAAAVIIYLSAAGENKSFYAVLAAMGLYVIYTIIEVRGALRLNRKKDGDS